MKKCGKARCQICEFVDEIDEFEVNGRTYQINYTFDCDTGGMSYLIKCKQCCKLYVESTIISFRKRFNNRESRIKRYEMGRRGIPGEHFYSHFFGEGHKGLMDVMVMIIDETNVEEPT